MTKEQIKHLKRLLNEFRLLQGNDRKEMKTQIIAYLAGCLDGLVI